MRVPARVFQAVVVVAPLFAVGTAHADGLRTVTIDEALRIAREKHPLLRVDEARVARASARVEVASAGWQPLVGFTAQGFLATANNTTGTYVGRRGVDVPRIGGTRVARDGAWAPDVSTFAGVGLAQEVFDFGRLRAEGRAARVEVDAERARGAVDWFRVVTDVEDGCFDVLAAHAVVHATEDALARARAHRDLASASASTGLRPPIELTRAEAEVARVLAQHARAEEALALSQATLAGAMGVDDDAVDVVAPSDGAEPAEVRARHPRLVAAEALVRVSEARARAVAAEGRPDLSLTATLSGRAGGATPSGAGERPRWGGYAPTVPNWDAGLVFTLPIWDGVQAARVGAARSDVDARRAELAAVTTDVDRVLRVARRAVALTEAAIPGLLRSVAAARANQAQADARSRAGIGTAVEVADAEALRTEAEVGLALAQLRVARTKRALRRAEGDLR